MATWSKSSRRRATRPRATGSPSCTPRARAAKFASGFICTSARKPPTWAAACSKKKRARPACSLKRIPTEDWQRVASEYGCSRVDDLYAELGYGKWSARQVLAKASGQPLAEAPAEEKQPKLGATVKRMLGIDDAAILVRGHGDLMVYRSKCCNPIPGDDIIGYVTRGRGIAVHGKNCPNVENLLYEAERRIPVEWAGTTQATFPVRLRIFTEDRPGMLAGITTVISDSGRQHPHLSRAAAKTIPRAHRSRARCPRPQAARAHSRRHQAHSRRLRYRARLQRLAFVAQTVCVALLLPSRWISPFEQGPSRRKPVIFPRHMVPRDEPLCTIKMMGTVQVTGSARGLGRAVRRRSSFATFFVFVALAMQLGCQSLVPLDTKPLDNAGMRYSSIKELKALHITAAKVGEIAKVRQSGLPDLDCVALLQIFHGRGEAFTAGDAIASLHQSGMSEGTVLYARQHGPSWAWVTANCKRCIWPGFRTPSLRKSRAIMPCWILPFRARLSGTLRNLRVDNATLLELVRRGVSDAQASAIITLRRHGSSDAEILC